MDRDRRDRDSLARMSLLVSALLAIQFSSGVVLASMALTAETLSSLSAAFEVYGVALAFVLLGAFAILPRLRGTPTAAFRKYSPLLVQGAVLVLWLASLSPFGSPSLQAAFPVFASIALAITAVLCPIRFPRPKGTWSGLGGWAQILLLLLVPLVFALRVAASFGVGTAPGPGGALEGNWLIVYGPTLLLEYFAVGMWLGLLWDSRSRGFRRQWTTWLPWVVLVPAVAGLFASDLFAFVFSAFITWGTNLAVFVPVTWSLSVAVVAIAGYASSFLLLRKLMGRNWKALFLGTACILLAGFYPSAVSVVGLSYGLLAIVATLAPGDRGRES